MKKNILTFLCTLILSLPAIFCIFLIWSAFFPFGLPYKLSEMTFGKGTLREISNITDVSFPEGTRGLNYYYDAGRDPSFSAKVYIPKEKKQKFFQLNASFKGWKKAPSAYDLPFQKKWWMPKNLSNAQHRKKYDECYQDCSDISYGEQKNGDMIVYISWFTT